MSWLEECSGMHHGQLCLGCKNDQDCIMVRVIRTVAFSFYLNRSWPINFYIKMVNVTALYVGGSKLILFTAKGLQMGRNTIIPLDSGADVEISSYDGNFVL